VPNKAPDIIGKVALDPSSKLHIEAGGIVRQFEVYNPTDNTKHSATGGGGFATLYFGLGKGLRVLGTGFLSDGGGRYIFGQAPDLIAKADGSLSTVKANSAIAGLEYTHKNTLLYGYYGGMWVDKNVATDTNGKLIGYGYDGSPSGQNHTIEEYTVGFSQTFWKDAKYGALNLMGQYSNLKRKPWFVAAGQPADASINMLFLNLRYTLPGAPPPAK
jgi:hypothetical protein